MSSARYSCSSGAFRSLAYSITGSAGLLGGIPVYLQGGMSNVIWMVAGITAGIVATFAATVVLYKEK